MKYALVNKKNIVAVGNTTASRYPVAVKVGSDGKKLPLKRKFTSRDMARDYKRTLSTKANWNIVDLRTMEVVR